MKVLSFEEFLYSPMIKEMSEFVADNYGYDDPECQQMTLIDMYYAYLNSPFVDPENAQDQSLENWLLDRVSFLAHTCDNMNNDVYDYEKPRDLDKLKRISELLLAMSKDVDNFIESFKK